MSERPRAMFRLPTPESLQAIKDGTALREARERVGSLATPRQLRCLRAVARDAGYDEAALENRCQQEHGFGLGTLDRLEASRMIDDLQAEHTQWGNA